MSRLGWLCMTVSLCILALLLLVFLPSDLFFYILMPFRILYYLIAAPFYIFEFTWTSFLHLLAQGFPL